MVAVAGTLGPSLERGLSVLQAAQTRSAFEQVLDTAGVVSPFALASLSSLLVCRLLRLAEDFNVAVFCRAATQAVASLRRS